MRYELQPLSQIATSSHEDAHTLLADLPAGLVAGSVVRIWLISAGSVTFGWEQRFYTMPLASFTRWFKEIA